MELTTTAGVWPTMITPYTREGRIDFRTLERLVEWYIERGVDGLFAVCQSSEMFFLSLKERLDLSRSCVRMAKGRIPVIASGHVAETLEDQIEEAKMMADTGVEAVVLITNRFAQRHESNDVFKRNFDSFLMAVPPHLRLGFYECPYPYKRLLSPDLVTHVLGTGRFDFLKDTSCDISAIEAKLALTRNSSFRLFNANAASLLQSLRLGAAGYSGVMANFHPQLYVWLCRNWATDPEEAETLQDFLGSASIVEYQFYPVNAMYFLSLDGVPFSVNSRRLNTRDFTVSMRLEMEQFHRISETYSRRFPVKKNG